MGALRTWLARWAGLWRGRGWERDLADELAAHRARLEAEARARGLEPAAARREAALRLGPVAPLEEAYRDQFAPRFVSDLGRDLRFAGRLLRRAPLFGAMAILSLALAIGAATAVFSVMEAYLWRPLPGVARPERLVHVGRVGRGGLLGPNLSYPEFEQLRRSPALSAMAVFWSDLCLVGRGREGRLVHDYLVSNNYFAVLGTRMFLGRGFLAQESAAVVVGYSFWREWLHADRGILGRTIPIDGHPLTVVGVAPPGFVGSERVVPPQLFLPLSVLNGSHPGIAAHLFTDRKNRMLWNVARLARGVGAPAAAAQLESLRRGLISTDPGFYRDVRFILAPTGLINADFRAMMLRLGLILLSLAGLVLLVACANLANLLLARGLERRRELAMRVALGGGRGRLVRQLATESLLLAALGGAGGILLAGALDRALPDARAFIFAPAAGFALDGRILGFALGATLLTALLCGFLPAWRATRLDPAPALKAGGWAGAARRPRLARALVALEAGLAAVAVVGGGLMLRSLGYLEATGPGFRSRQVLAAAFDLDEQGYNRARGQAFYRELLTRARALPGIRSASLAEYLPLTQMYEDDASVAVPGRSRPSVVAYSEQIAPGYFRTLGMPLVRGRDFAAGDGPRAAPVAIVNRKLAQSLFGGGEALGRAIRFRGRTWRIVGVAPDSDFNTVGEAPQEAVYFPAAQDYSAHLNLLVRTRGDPRALEAGLRTLVADLDPNLAISSVTTLAQTLGAALLPLRAAAALVGGFAVLALLLAAIGVYGVTAHAVARRTPEFGLRLALGAQPGQVLRLAVGQAMAPALAGLAAGLAAAAAAAGAMGALLYGVGSRDPATYVAVALVLGGAALAASYLPARRAIRLDALRALRSE